MIKNLPKVPWLFSRRFGFGVWIWVVWLQSPCSELFCSSPFLKGAQEALVFFLGRLQQNAGKTTAAVCPSEGHLPVWVPLLQSQLMSSTPLLCPVPFLSFRISRPNLFSLYISQVKYYLRFSSIQRNFQVSMAIFQDDVKGWSTSFLYPPNPSPEPRNFDYSDGGSPGEEAYVCYHEQGHFHPAACICDAIFVVFTV